MILLRNMSPSEMFYLYRDTFGGSSGDELLARFRQYARPIGIGDDERKGWERLESRLAPQVFAALPSARAVEEMFPQYLPVLEHEPVFCPNVMNEGEHGWLGDCKDMHRDHDATLFLRKGLERHYGRTTPVVMDDARGVARVVGSIKREGDPSLIALRNVLDDQGRLALAMGAVYQPGPYSSMRAHQPSAPFAPVRLDALSVLNLRFMQPQEPFSDYLDGLTRVRRELEDAL